jgi:hypothetical protein
LELEIAFLEHERKRCCTFPASSELLVAALKLALESRGTLRAPSELQVAVLKLALDSRGTLRASSELPVAALKHALKSRGTFPASRELLVSVLKLALESRGTLRASSELLVAALKHALESRGTLRAPSELLVELMEHTPSRCSVFSINNHLTKSRKHVAGGPGVRPEAIDHSLPLSTHREDAKPIAVDKLEGRVSLAEVDPDAPCSEVPLVYLDVMKKHYGVTAELRQPRFEVVLHHFVGMEPVDVKQINAAIGELIDSIVEA